MSTTDITFDDKVWTHLAKGANARGNSNKFPFLKHRNDQYKISLEYDHIGERVEVFYNSGSEHRQIGCHRKGEHFRFYGLNQRRSAIIVASIRNTVAESQQAILDFIDGSKSNG